MHEILDAVLLEDLEPMAATKSGADRADVTTVLLEDEEVVLRVIRHEVDAAGLILGKRVGIDHRSDRRIGLGPVKVEGITVGSVSEDDGRLSGEKRRDEEQGKETHEGMAAD
jgi:hypothetical protein